MPELPEVEHLRRTLEPILLGRTIRSVRVLTRRVVVAPGDPPGGGQRSPTAAEPRRLAPASLLAGSRIEGLQRHGKHLAIISAAGPALDVHLGMTGSLRAVTSPLPTHAHVIWTLDDGVRLAFLDPRRFGGLWLFDSFDALHAARWAPLGPDALTIRAASLALAVAGSARPIKSILLDQTRLAGVGNIYADEALFRARISPARPATRMTPDDAASLAAAIRFVLRSAIKRGGSSIRDYRDATDRVGTAQLHHRVYGRAGLPCRRCRATLESSALAQRTTVWCPTCQPH